MVQYELLGAETKPRPRNCKSAPLSQPSRHRPNPYTPILNPILTPQTPPNPHLDPDPPPKKRPNRAMKTQSELPAESPASLRMHQDKEDLDEAVKDELDPLKRDGYAPFPAAQTPPLETERECLDVAEELRSLGNSHFANGDYALALRKYGKALRYLRHRWHMTVPPGCSLGAGGIKVTCPHGPPADGPSLFSGILS